MNIFKRIIVSAALIAVSATGICADPTTLIMHRTLEPSANKPTTVSRPLVPPKSTASGPVRIVIVSPKWRGF